MAIDTSPDSNTRIAKYSFNSVLEMYFNTIADAVNTKRKRLRKRLRLVLTAKKRTGIGTRRRSRDSGHEKRGLVLTHPVSHGVGGRGREKIIPRNRRPRLSSPKSGRIAPFRLRRMTGTSGLFGYFSRAGTPQSFPGPRRRPSRNASAERRTTSEISESRLARGLAFRQIMPMVRDGCGSAKRATETDAEQVSMETAISGINVTPIPALTIWTSVDNELASITCRGNGECILQNDKA